MTAKSFENLECATLWYHRDRKAMLLDWDNAAAFRDPVTMENLLRSGLNLTPQELTTSLRFLFGPYGPDWHPVGLDDTTLVHPLSIAMNYTDRFNQAADIILKNGPNLVDSFKYEYIAADRIIKYGHTEAAAHVVLATIQQHIRKEGIGYKTDFNATGLFTTEKGKRYLDNIAAVHGRVREMLEGKENPVAESLMNGDKRKVSFWLKDFKKPKLKRLPKPIKKEPSFTCLDLDLLREEEPYTPCWDDDVNAPHLKKQTPLETFAEEPPGWEKHVLGDNNRWLMRFIPGPNTNVFNDVLYGIKYE